MGGGQKHGFSCQSWVREREREHPILMHTNGRFESAINLEGVENICYYNHAGKEQHSMLFWAVYLL